MFRVRRRPCATLLYSSAASGLYKRQAVSGAFVQAEAAVRELVATFRIEVVAMRHTTALEPLEA